MPVLACRWATLATATALHSYRFARRVQAMEATGNYHACCIANVRWVASSLMRGKV